MSVILIILFVFVAVPIMRSCAKARREEGDTKSLSGLQVLFVACLVGLGVLALGCILCIF
jgi:hypothetical protein